MKKIYLITFILFFIKLNAQNKFHKVDSLLNYLQKNDKFMGSLSIKEGNNFVFSKSYGYSNLIDKTKSTVTTQYKIGSVTKIFTSILILQLIEENKLKLDTKISKYFPKIDNANEISIENLLHHRSGIKDYINQDTLTSSELASENIKGVIISKIENYKALNLPNTKFEYSNSNYYLLGNIIEQITQKSYAENVEKRISNKLKLLNTFYPYEPEKQKNISKSYTFKEKKWLEVNASKPDVVFSAGGIVSTTQDLTTLMNALFEGKLIKSKSLEQMTLLKDGYGKALMQFPFGERKFYGHTGTIEGFKSVVGYYPPEKLSISLIINGENFNQNEIMIGLLSIYYKLPFIFPSFIELDFNKLSKYYGEYTSKDTSLKINIFEKNGEFLAQATGQNSFPLTQVEETSFVFQQAKVEIEFKENSFILKQGNTKLIFNKN